MRAPWRTPASPCAPPADLAGGYRLGGGYRTRLTGIGLDEAGALAFLGLGAPAEQLGLGDLVEGLQTKIWAALTTEARESAQRTAERFHLDQVRWFARPEPVPCLGPLAVALWGDRRVRLDYDKGGAPPAARWTRSVSCWPRVSGTSWRSVAGSGAPTGSRASAPSTRSTSPPGARPASTWRRPGARPVVSSRASAARST